MKNDRAYQYPAVSVGNLNLLRALGRGNFPVITATSIANEVTFYSRYKSKSYRIPGPTKTPIEFTQALIELGKEIVSTSPVLFYDADADLLCISRNRQKLNKYYRFNMPSENVIESLVDKSRFIGYAKEYNLPIPRARLFGSHDDIDKISSEHFSLPVIIKPVSRVDWFDSPLAKAFGKGGKAILVHSKQELDQIVGISKEHRIGIIIQELIAGDESQILSYHSYIGQNGNILGEYTGRKHRTFPNQFGMSTCVEVCEINEVINAGRAIIESTGLVGIVKFDFKKEPTTGKLYLLEINPRFNIWNYPGAIAGVNLPVIAYCDIVGIKSNFDIKLNKRIKWIDAARDRKLYKELGRGPAFYIESWLKNLNFNTVYTLWAWDDPVPFFRCKLNRIVEVISKAQKKLFGYLFQRSGNLR